MAALSSSPPRPERRPLGLGGLERVLVQSVWAAVASGGPLRVREYRWSERGPLWLGGLERVLVQ